MGIEAREEKTDPRVFQTRKKDEPRRNLAIPNIWQIWKNFGDSGNSSMFQKSSLSALPHMHTPENF